MFPNDAAGDVDGRALADHGELWSQPWALLERGPAALLLRYACRTVPVDVEKSFRLAGDVLHLRYRLRNRSADAVPFLFRLHAAVAVGPGDCIDLPGCTVEAVDAGFSRMIGAPGRHPFPRVPTRDGGTIRLDEVRSPDSGLRELVYVRDLEGGALWHHLPAHR